jgi:cell division protein FtsL
MEWLRTLVWIFSGGEKSLITFIAVATVLAFFVPLDQQTATYEIKQERSAVSAGQGGE